jgi:hypothetical protein
MAESSNGNSSINIGHVSAAEVVIGAATFGPFVTAFCTELGKRFGGTVADWTSRVHLRRKGGGSTKADLIVEVDDDVTVLELEDDLPDEARLALLELDIKQQAVRGRRLTWNAAAQAWLPVTRPLSG